MQRQPTSLLYFPPTSHRPLKPSLPLGLRQLSMPVHNSEVFSRCKTSAHEIHHGIKLFGQVTTRDSLHRSRPLLPRTPKTRFGRYSFLSDGSPLVKLIAAVCVAITIGIAVTVYIVVGGSIGLARSMLVGRAIVSRGSIG
jgi:hypothetical protein